MFPPLPDSWLVSYSGAVRRESFLPLQFFDEVGSNFLTVRLYVSLERRNGFVSGHGHQVVRTVSASEQIGYA